MEFLRESRVCQKRFLNRQPSSVLTKKTCLGLNILLNACLNSKAAPTLLHAHVYVTNSAIALLQTTLEKGQILVQVVAIRDKVRGRLETTWLAQIFSFVVAGFEGSWCDIVLRSLCGFGVWMLEVE